MYGAPACLLHAHAGMPCAMRVDGHQLGNHDACVRQVQTMAMVKRKRIFPSAKSVCEDVDIMRRSMGHL